MGLGVTAEPAAVFLPWFMVQVFYLNRQYKHNIISSGAPPDMAGWSPMPTMRFEK